MSAFKEPNAQATPAAFVQKANSPAVLSASQLREFFLSYCGQFSIHTIDSIQPHGVFFVLDPKTFVILYTSENIPDFFKSVSPSTLGTCTLEKVFGREEWTRLKETIQKLETRKQNIRDLNPYRIGFPQGHSAKYSEMDIILHYNKQGFLILELEPFVHINSSELDASDNLSFHHLNSLLDTVQSCKNLKAKFQWVCQHIHQRTGFDRVMTYQFDPLWNGQVIVESAREGLPEGYLGLHFPASDIPPQARELYTKNLLRFIPNTQYKAASIQAVSSTKPGEGLQTEPDLLDMTYCTLRSVAPTHLEYLENMGVHATLTISIMHKDTLWGMIVCHHYSPRWIPSSVRSYCELLGRIMSAQVMLHIERDEIQEEQKKRMILSKIAARLGRTEDLATALTHTHHNLLDLFDATGVVICLESFTRATSTLEAPLQETENRSASTEKIPYLTQGIVPSLEDVALLHQWLKRKTSSIFCSDSLSRDISASFTDSFREIACGLFYISLTRDGEQFIMCFRQEQPLTVNWAGQPEEFVLSEDGSKLHPRKSFKIWQQVLHGLSHPWQPVLVSIAKSLTHSIWEKQYLNSRKRVEAEMLRWNDELEQHVQQRTLELENANRGLEKTLDKLLKSEEQREVFVSAMTHDMKTPLVAQKRALEILLAQKETTSPRLVKLMEQMAKSNDDLLDFVKKMLEIYRFESGQIELVYEPIVLHALVNECFTEVSHWADSKKINLHNKVSETFPFFPADSHLLKRVLMNLIGNSLENISGKAVIEIKAAIEEDEKQVSIYVQDTGPGISEALKPYLFNRHYFSGKTQKKIGTGLGLSICKMILEQHQGKISWVEAATGVQGTCFKLQLPLHAPPKG